VTENLPVEDYLAYRGTGEADPGAAARHLPGVPPWRESLRARDANGGHGGRGLRYQVDPEQAERVNAALYLRRPLLVTGAPGTGKSSLAYAVAAELGLEPVLRWPITSKSALRDGLYYYDAIGRLQEANLNEIKARRQRLATPARTLRWAPSAPHSFPASARESCWSTSWTRVTSTCRTICWTSSRKASSRSRSLPGSRPTSTRSL